MILFQAVVNIGDNLKTIAPTTIFDLGKLIGGLAGVGLIAAGAMSFGFFVYGGVKWVMAGGEKGKIEEAQQMITNALIGLAVTSLAFAIFQIVQYVLGVNIVNH
jgi:lysylphosphatidylglycerol synthetase-like protein (DUF2156 family)